MAHWSERPEFAERAQRIFNSIPPKEWESWVWTVHGTRSAVLGTLDKSDALRLIARILEETIYDDD